MPHFGWLDWLVVVVYFSALVIAGIAFQPKSTKDSRDYFLADNKIPSWLAAVSVLAATQSAATFLGAPDYGYRGDLTYLGTNIGTLLAAYFVGRVFIPRFYKMRAATVYELLKVRFGNTAMRAAGGMFLLGRVLAGGARVYLAAIAISMIMFSNVTVSGMVLATFLIVAISFGFSFVGGLKSVIWNDLVQFIIYIGSAVGVLIFLRSLIPSTTNELIDGLVNTPSGINKLRLFDFSADFSLPFSVFSIFTGHFLLNVGNFGMDQDTTQRLLASKDSKAGAASLYISALAAVPVIFVFMVIGLLLYVFYNRPDLMHTAGNRVGDLKFHGDTVTVFMYFILTQIPTGLRGLATVGVIAAAVSTTNSALNAMSSVMIQDFYKPWMEKRRVVEGEHFVVAGRYGMAITGFLTFVMSIVCYFWQNAIHTPLLQFVLSIMTFSYSGLLGVYFTAMFTRRGSSKSVILALITGFVVILAMQPWFPLSWLLPTFVAKLAFTWQLCIGAVISFLVCAAAKGGDINTANGVTS
jgi:Na+/proline symporter